MEQGHFYLLTEMQVEWSKGPNLFPVGSDLDRIVQGMGLQDAPKRSPNLFPVGSDLDRIVQGMAPQDPPQEGECSHMEPGVSGIARTPEHKFMWRLDRLDLDDITTARAVEIGPPKGGGECGLEGSLSPEIHKLVEILPSVEFGVPIGGLATMDFGMPKNDDSMWEIGGVASKEVVAPEDKAEGSMPPRANQNHPVSSLEAPIPKLLEIASLPDGDGDTDVPMMELGIIRLATEMPVEKTEGSMAPPGIFWVL